MVGGTPVEGIIPTQCAVLLQTRLLHIVPAVIVAVMREELGANLLAGDIGRLQPVVDRITSLRWVFAPRVPPGSASISGERDVVDTNIL